MNDLNINPVSVINEADETDSSERNQQLHNDSEIDQNDANAESSNSFSSTERNSMNSNALDVLNSLKKNIQGTATLKLTLNTYQLLAEVYKVQRKLNINFSFQPIKLKCSNCWRLKAKNFWK